MDNNMDTECAKNLMLEYMYSSIFEKCYNSYDEIVKNDIFIHNNIERLKTTQIYKENNINATDREIVAHSMTLIILMHIMCGNFSTTK